VSAFQKTDKVAIPYLNRTIEASRAQPEHLSQGANPHRAYNISYDTMPQPTREHKFGKGFRPRGSNKHAAIMLFNAMTIEKQSHNFAMRSDHREMHCYALPTTCRTSCTGQIA
jgi:hypothetical protein